MLTSSWTGDSGLLKRWSYPALMLSSWSQATPFSKDPEEKALTAQRIVIKSLIVLQDIMPMSRNLTGNHGSRKSDHFS